MCPTYFDCGESLAFCLWAVGKSRCIKAEQGCICGGCPVFVENEFTGDGYFCTRGTAREQAGA
jgi:hypothetical protein